MSLRPKGKNVTIDVNNPEALGICDFSGFVFKRKDLLRQMEWRGDSLQWTGFYVGRPYLDVPNEQNRPPILPPDPIPVLFPRPQQPQSLTIGNSNYLTIGQLNNITIGGWSSNEDGIQAPSDPQRLQDLQNFQWGS